MVEELFDPQTPSFKFRIIDVRRVLEKAEEKIPPASESDWKAMSENIIAILIDTGYRLDVKTPLEHALVGSSSGEEYLSTFPLRPIGIVEDKFTIAEAIVARRLDTLFYPLGIVYGIKAAFVNASLEPLNEIGDALRLPRIVNMKKLKRALESKTVESAIDIAATGQKLILNLLSDLPKETIALIRKLQKSG